VDEARSLTAKYLQEVTRERLWSFARRHWFDAFLLVSLGVGITEAVLTQDDKNGPLGPMWFDILATVGIIVPLFFRRRYPFYAPVASGVVFALSSFVAADGKTSRKGMPNPLRLAVIAKAHFDTVRLPFPPAWMQAAGLALGAPLGRLLGYGATYQSETKAPAVPAVA
jgi:hypothetical protein